MLSLQQGFCLSTMELCMDSCSAGRQAGFISTRSYSPPLLSLLDKREVSELGGLPQNRTVTLARVELWSTPEITSASEVCFSPRRTSLQ